MALYVVLVLILVLAAVTVPETVVKICNATENMYFFPICIISPIDTYFGVMVMVVHESQSVRYGFPLTAMCTLYVPGLNFSVFQSMYAT